MIWCMWITGDGQIDIWKTLGDDASIDRDAERWKDVIFFEAELTTE